MIRVFIAVSIIISSLSAFSQDTARSVVLKFGIYESYDDVLKNSPSFTLPFQVFPSYKTIVKDRIIGDLPTGESIRDTLSIDTVLMGYYYLLPKGAVEPKKVFGFYDGRQLYIDVKRGIDVRSRRLFVPLDYIGRYSFVVTDAKKPVTYFNLGVGALLDQALSKKKETIFYFNKDGEFTQATAQAIGFLLRKDKDLYKEYNAEKKLNNQVFKKYLIKMNERYPL